MEKKDKKVFGLDITNMGISRVLNELVDERKLMITEIKELRGKNQDMKVLKFSEYRISYAREIIEMRMRKGTHNQTLEEIMLGMYCHYLTVCGNKELSDKVWKELKGKVQKYNEETTQWNDKYDSEFIDRMNEVVDNMCGI
jgi:TRAP-type mannitol/chloroaromatic compound transport system substrate-binding protein